MAPTESGDFLIGVRAAYEELNRSVRSPEPCTYTRRVEGVDEERTGFLRWRSTRADEIDHHSILGTDPEDGRIWRQECFDPTLGEEYGDYLRVQFFPVTEANLARMAIDDFLLGLPSPTVHTAPANRTLVNLDTWFWVDGVDGGERTSPVVSVPGMAVVATARATTVQVDPGDGSGGFTCAVDGMPYSPSQVTAPPCAHTYRRSAVGYQGAATVVWSGTYTVNGAGPFPVEEATTRRTPFEIQVAERQAINVPNR